LAVTDVLGHPKFRDDKGCIAFGSDRGPRIFIVTPFDRAAAAPGNGVHVAFSAPTRAMIDAFYAAALANGGSDEGPPCLRRYHPNY
jgi:catechol 2,3-dioxygenase-like lactoylglutathione lyase family enzyme